MPADAPRVVADASVLGSLIFGEPKAEQAWELLKGAQLIEPTILPYELASVARKKVLKYPAQRAAIFSALRLGLSLDMRWVDVDHDTVVELALEKGLTSYDAAYLWVSRLCGAPLVTFDERLRAAST